LAALLVVIGFKMMDWKSLELAVWKGTVLDFLVILAVVIVANTVSLIAASGLGVLLAILMFIREQIHTTTIRKKAYGNKVFSKRFRNPEEWAVLEQAGERNVIYELQGSLFFGTTDQLYSALEPELSKARYVLLDFNKVQSLDVTACHMIERILHILQEHQATLIISRLPENLPSGRDLHSYLDHIGILSKPNTKVFGDMLDALEWMENQTIEAAGLQGNAQNALALAQFDIFQGFSVDQLARLEQCATMRTFVVGEQIFKAGEFGHELMLIARGQVKVSLALEASKTLHLATMGRGQFFGEMSFMDGSIYSADVYAVDEVQVWSIAREQFKPLDAKDQAMQALITKAIALALAQRLRYTNAELLELKNQS
jgi:SulP family sulfate permease